MSVEPKPCPSCGAPGRAPTVLGVHPRTAENRHQRLHAVECACGMSGPMRRDSGEAIAVWNRLVVVGDAPPPETDSARLGRVVGARLLRWRESQGLNQPDAAERVGMQRTQYGRIERGQSLPSVESAMSICNATGMTPNQLFGVEVVP